ncbi:MAG: ubiquinol-cytochrome c reductase iron-sulfur subunit [Janthinobacterium lividum]
MTEDNNHEEVGTLTRREVLRTAAGAGLALLMAGQANAAADNWTAVGKIETFVKNKPQRVAVAGGGVLYVTRIDADTLKAVSAKCTHHGCEVSWTAEDVQLQCPCHGAAFASDGKNVHGTRRSPDEHLPALPTVPVRQKAGQVEVNLGTVAPADIDPKLS